MASCLSAESLKVSYVFGKTEIIEKTDQNQSITSVKQDATIETGQFIGTGKGSRAEFIAHDVTWRLGSLSFAEWKSVDHFWLHSGSVLYSSSKVRRVVFSSRKSSCIFEGKGTIIVEALQNGGFKFIPFEAKGSIYTEDGKSKELKDGRLLLVVGSPSYLGDAYDIDLMLMMRSSRLINAFPDILPTFNQMYLALYVQALTVDGKYDALIGDAPTDTNLQLWAFGKKAPAKSQKLTIPKKTTNLHSKPGFWARFTSSSDK